MNLENMTTEALNARLECLHDIWNIASFETEEEDLITMISCEHDALDIEHELNKRWNI